MPDNTTSELGQAIHEVSERASLLVREEIELAKAEMTQQVMRLIKGAVVGIVAGIFAVFGLIYLLHSFAWLIYDLLDSNSPWLGFLIVAVLLFVFGALAGLLAMRFVKRGSPPTPALAIEEAQLIRATVTQSHPAPQGPAATTPARGEVTR